MIELPLYLVVFSILVGTGGLGWLANAYFTSKKIMSEVKVLDVNADSVVVRSASDVVAMQSGLLQKYHAENIDLRKRISQLERRIGALEAFIRLNTEFDPLTVNGDRTPDG